MNIGFVLPSVSRRGGGVFYASRLLATALHQPPIRRVNIFGLADEGALEDSAAWGEVPVAVASARPLQKFGLSRELDIKMSGTDLDLLHTHGLWSCTSVTTRRWSDATARPYVVSPHGMLDPWALRHSRWKKIIAGLLYETAHLKGAGCLHALCQSELESIRAAGYSNPVCVVPNGIEIEDEAPADASRLDPLLGDRPMLLYLGRLHPKKGLAELLRGWAMARRHGGGELRDWVLVIAGWDELGYQQELERTAEQLGISQSVLLTGPCFGAEKRAFFRRAAGFVLPSFSEGQPMAVLEAWSYSLPVLMTPACNLPEGFAAEAALSMDPKPTNIARALDELVQMGAAGRAAMGARGRRLVEAEFTPDIVAERMAQIYTWLLGGGQKPESVHAH